MAFGSPPPPKEGPALKKGVKKKDLRSLPKFTAIDESVVKFSNFAICLSEFAADDEIWVLLQGGHGFHVCCIVPLDAGGFKCRGFPAPANSSSAAPGLDPEVRFKLQPRFKLRPICWSLLAFSWSLQQIGAMVDDGNDLDGVVGSDPNHGADEQDWVTRIMV